MTEITTKPDASEINVHPGGVTFAGRDAVHLFRAITLKSGISLHQKCGMIPTRGMTITKMLAMAEEFTGKKYKRGDHQGAIADLQVWIDTMKAAMPITNTTSS